MSKPRVEGCFKRLPTMFLYKRARYIGMKGYGAVMGRCLGDKRITVYERQGRYQKGEVRLLQSASGRLVYSA